MGFALTIVYVILTIFGPEQFGPEWANYHALAYLACFTFLASLPNIVAYVRLRPAVQVFLFLGFIISIGLSHVANGWLGGALESWQLFFPSAAVFFFIVVNVCTVRRLKIVTLAAVASCLVVVVESLCGYYGGFHGDTFVLRDGQIIGDFFRLRGVGFLNDPNDFAQILLIALPLIFIAWRRGRAVANSVIVLVPATVLLWAIYLTHSRGGLIALAILALMASRKGIGTTPSAVLAGVLMLGMMALDFTGGRGISLGEGAERLDAWAAGLEMFKSAPLFGVGFGNFTVNNNLTAHNSFVLCLAELGIAGSIIWVALFATTIISLTRIIGLHETGVTPRGGLETVHRAVETGKAQELSTSTFAGVEVFSFDGNTNEVCARELHTDGLNTVTLMEELISEVDLKREEHSTLSARVASSCRSNTTTATAAAADVETRVTPLHQYNVPKWWVMAMFLALVSFLTTSWFLSRSYSTTMCLVLGLTTATISLRGAATESRDRNQWVFLTLAIEALAIIFIYGIVRLAH